MTFVGLGACTHELIGIVDRMPPVGTTQDFRQFSIQGSGTAANAMSYLARWGQHARFVSKVGDDRRGSDIIESLAAEGVDTSLMIRQEGAISQMKWLIGETRQTGFRSFATEGTVKPLEPGELDYDLVLEHGEILLLDARYPRISVELAKVAKSKNFYILFYADELTERHQPLLPLVDHVIASERIAGRFIRHSKLEGICDEILSLGPGTITITIGSEGVVGKNREGEYAEQPGLSIQFTDALGANGAYFAAAAYAYSQGMSFQRTLEFSNAAAALSCTGFGPRAHIPSLESIFSLCSKE